MVMVIKFFLNLITINFYKLRGHLCKNFEMNKKKNILQMHFLIISIAKIDKVDD